jgi:hypothetical protein
MQSKLVITAFVTIVLYGVCTSCAAMESVWDTTVSVFDSDTGEETEVAIGDVVADSADEVGGIISTLLGTNPALAAVGGAAAAALLGGARRKKKLKAEAEKKG